MKKIFIIGSKGPYSIGGYETFVRCVGPELVDMGYDVYVTSESCPEDEEKKDLPFNVVHMFRESKNISPFVRIIYDLYAAFLSVRHRADVVYMCGYNAAWVLIVPLLFGKKVFINSDGIEWARPSWGKKAVKRYYLIINEYLMKLLPMVVISDSRAIAAFLQKRLGLHSHFIPYGGDSFEFQRQDSDKEVLRRHKLQPGNYYFISVRIVEDNFIDKLIEAFQDIDAMLVIIGAMPDTDYGRYIQSILHPKILVLDLTSMDPDYNIIRCYAKANIHSHRFGGTSPNLLEVMNLEVPIIAFDTDYSREVLGDHALFYDSPGSLVAAIRQFQQLPAEEVAGLVSANRQRIDDLYNWHQVAGQCAKLFQG